MKTNPSLRLAVVALLAAAVLVLLGSAAPERGIAQGDVPPVGDGGVPVVEGDEPSPALRALEGVTSPRRAARPRLRARRSPLALPPCSRRAFETWRPPA
jgi:hypothetical protein